MSLSLEDNSISGSSHLSPNHMSHRVVTFYSYKGGVGRSMALANIAMLLARDHGLRVLAVDWDLEAPGLHRYFNMSDDVLGEGIIDYLDNYKELVRTPKTAIKPEALSIKRYARQILEFKSGGSVHIIGAGSQRSKPSYINKVRGFDWEDFYDDWNGAQVVEGLRNEFLEMADVTLVDSRTGITDVGGVCTVQLPDVVVFVFVFNVQNLDGIEQVADELSDNNNPSLKALNRKPELLFLACRKELSELTRLRDWEAEAASRFERFCDTPKIKNAYSDTTTYLRKTSVPYVPYFAYGEELAAKSDKGIELAEAFEPIIDLMLTELSKEPVGESQRHWIMILRPIRVCARLMATLSATLVALFLLTNLIGNVGWWAIMRGGIGGILGASLLPSLSRFGMFGEENAWRLHRRGLLVSFIVVMIGGCFLGIAASLLPVPSRYYLILCITLGFLLSAFVKFTFTPGFVKGFNKGRAESRAAKRVDSA